MKKHCIILVTLLISLGFYSCSDSTVNPPSGTAADSPIYIAKLVTEDSCSFYTMNIDGTGKTWVGGTSMYASRANISYPSNGKIISLINGTGSDSASFFLSDLTGNNKKLVLKKSIVFIKTFWNSIYLNKINKFVYADAGVYPKSDIYVINEDGTNNTRIFENQMNFIISDDQTKIFVTSNDDNKLYVINIDGTDKKIVSDVFSHPISVSPDNKKLAFGSFNGFIISDIDGNNARVIKNNDTAKKISYDYALWSQDSKKIIFCKNSSNIYSLHIINPDGTGEKVLIDSCTNMLIPKFYTNDGKKLIYQEQNYTYTTTGLSCGALKVYEFATGKISTIDESVWHCWWYK